MTLRAAWVVPMIALAACGRDLGTGTQPDYGLGRAATASEIAMIDIDAAPDGAGLPPGRGTVESF